MYDERGANYDESTSSLYLSHISGGRSRSPRRLSSTPIVMHNRTTFDRIGSGSHTLERWENDASWMSGYINRQSIVYKSAGHLLDVGLASGEDL